jgi:uncharacterized protein
MSKAGSRWAWQRRLRIEAVHERIQRDRARQRWRKYVNGPAIKGALLHTGLRALGLYSRARREADTPVVTEQTFRFGNLPPGLAGLRILHLSDLHMDGRPGHADRLAALVSTIEADLCVLTGDFHFDYLVEDERVVEDLRQVVSRVHAPYGMYAVMGNHDDSRLIAPLEAMGVHLLLNSHRRLKINGESLWLIGVDDPARYGCDDLAAAMDGTPVSGFRILLAHSPDLVEEAAESGIDLYLCGHTHGGQVVLPWLGPIYSNSRCKRRYARGVWRHGRMQGCTSMGLGCVYVPVRIGCPPEAVRITLKQQRNHV